MSLRPSPRTSTVARRLREARARADLAQDALGVLAGLEESSASARMSRYESGIHEPSLQFIEAVAKVIGISASYFYCKDDRLADIIRAYSDLSEAKRELLHQSALEFAK